MYRVLPTLLLTALLFLPVACGELTEYDTEQVRSTLHDSLLTTSESWNIDMRLMEKGNRRILLQADYAVDYQENRNRETRIRGPVYIQIFDSTGALESEAWSRRAIYHPEEKEFELIDSVRIQTVTDRELFSSYIRWQEQNGRITSDRHVIIITPSDSISGSGFEGKSDLSSYIITDPRGRVIVD